MSLITVTKLLCLGISPPFGYGTVCSTPVAIRKVDRVSRPSCRHPSRSSLGSDSPKAQRVQRSGGAQAGRRDRGEEGRCGLPPLRWTVDASRSVQRKLPLLVVDRGQVVEGGVEW